MCVRSVRVDEARLRRINPSFNDVAVIDRWLEMLVSSAMRDMENGLVSFEPTTEEVYDAIEQRVKGHQATIVSMSEDYAIDVEAMRERLHRMVHEVYSMP